MALILCPSARAADVGFDSSISAGQAHRYEELIRSSWAAWEARFATPNPLVQVYIGVTDVVAMPFEAGRTQPGRIELNRLLAAGDADRVILHELAHLFLETRCPGSSRSVPRLSEAFALWTADDAGRRALIERRFESAAAARRWLRGHLRPTLRERAAEQDALARVLAEPTGHDAYEAGFRRLIETCRADGAPVADDWP